MVFLLAAALLLTAWRFTLRARRCGPLRTAKSVAVAAASGLLAGGFIGFGARLGMGAITVANGDVPRFTWPGSIAVVVTFASYGIVLGIVYEGAFRQLLRRSGVAYGLLLTLCSWYPLAHAAAQQLRGSPAPGALIAVSGILVAAMWLPYGAALEALLSKWLHRDTASALASTAA